MQRIVPHDELVRVFLRRATELKTSAQCDEYVVFSVHRQFRVFPPLHTSMSMVLFEKYYVDLLQFLDIIPKMAPLRIVFVLFQ